MKDSVKKELKKKLDPKNVKTRDKGSSSIAFVEGWHVINEANNIFGFDGWSRSTVYNNEVSRVTCRVGKGQYQSEGFKVGYEAKVLITVGDVTREGTGHGSQVSKDLFDAIEGAAKEAETDATKRALMTFGYRFGLALYDKTKQHVGNEPPETQDKPEKTENKRDAAIGVANNIMLQMEEAKTLDDILKIEKNNAKLLTAMHEKYPDIAEQIVRLGARKRGEFQGILGE